MSEPLNVINEKPWYSNGLNFKCTGCGQCCTGSPGYIWVTLEEITQIANYLNLTVDEFSKQYVKKVGKRYSLLEKPSNRENPADHDCMFLKDKKCLIYPVRPKQCGTFPWWPQNLANPQAWAEVAKECEGINADAPLISLEEIHAQLHKQMN